MLVVQLLMVVQRMPYRHYPPLCVQSLLLCGIAATIALVHNATDVYFVVGPDAAGKVVSLPLFLKGWSAESMSNQEIEPLLKSPTAMVLCGGVYPAGISRCAASCGQGGAGQQHLRHRRDAGVDGVLFDVQPPQRHHPGAGPAYRRRTACCWQPCR